jgi:hypothetical protein
MAVKSVSWESSRISVTMIDPGPVCEDTITLGDCDFFAAPTASHSRSRRTSTVSPSANPYNDTVFNGSCRMPTRSQSIIGEWSILE